MKTTTIYVREGWDSKLLEVKARTFKVQLSTGLIVDVAIHRPIDNPNSKKGWTSSEVSTGLAIWQTAEPTIKQALDKAGDRLQAAVRQGFNFESIIKANALSK